MLRRIAQIILLLFSLIVPIQIVLFFTLVGAGEETDSIFFVVLFCLGFISVPGAFIIYLLNVLRNKRIPKDNKHLWIALLIFGNLLIYPVYWYLYIWREPETPG